MNVVKSLQQQSRVGTLERNREIRAKYRSGLGAKLGREYNVSRQRIHQIVKLPISERTESKSRRFWHKAIVRVKKVLWK